MAWFSTAILFVLAAAAVADQEACTGTSMLATKPAAHKKKAPRRRTPAATEPEGAATETDGEAPKMPDPADLTAASEAQSELSQQQITRAHEMGHKDDHFVHLAKNAKHKAVASGKASISHAEAEQAFHVAKDRARDASLAKANSIKETKGSEAAKAHYEEMLKLTAGAQERYLKANDEWKKAKVVEDTKDMAAQRLKEATALAQTKFDAAKETKKAADSVVEKAKKDSFATTEELQKAQALAAKKKEEWEAAEKASDEASDEAINAMNHLTALAEQFGQEQATTAAAEVTEQNAEALREKAQTDYTFRLEQTHHDLEVATEQEATASARVAEAHSLSTVANSMASKASTAPTVGWMDRTPAAAGPAAAAEVAAPPPPPE